MGVPRLLLGAVIVVVVIGILGVTGVLARARQLIPGLQQAAPTYRTATVSRGNIEVSVIATGPISAVNQLPLTFKSSGKLAELDVQPGQTVKKGQVLAKLDTTDLQAALDQAKANLEQAQANLQKVQAGATETQKQVAQTAVDNARTAAANAQESINTAKTTAANSVTAAQQSVRTAQLNLAAAQDALKAAQDQEARGIAADQAAIANAQKNLENVKAAAAADGPIQQQNLEKAKDNLWAVQISRDATCGRSKGADCQAANANVAAAETSVNTTAAQVAQALQQDQQQIATAQSQLDQANAQLADDKAKLGAAVVAAQNQVKQAQAALAAAQNGVAQAQAQATATVHNAIAQADQANGSLKSAQANYNQTVATPEPSDIAAAKAQVVNAQVAVETAQNNLDAATLTAPFDGIVAAVNGTVGQQVTGGPVNTNTTESSSALITLVDLNTLQVTAQVNEADIGKVKTGDPVTFTVSAFPDRRFSGKVLSIQPIGTVVQNVVNYSVTCSIQPEKDALLYPGMTAAANIVSERRNDVLVVPNAALSFAQSAFRDGLVQFAGEGTGPSRTFNRAGGANTGQASPGQQARPNATQQPQGQQARPNGGQAAAAQEGGQSAGARPQGQRTGQQGAGAEPGASANRVSLANRGVILTLKNGQLVPIRVTLGVTDGSNTEIVSGLQGGEQIVIGQGGALATANRQQGGPGGPRGNVFVGGFGR